MRVLHVVPTYYPAIRYGGPIVAVHGLARGLAARGHHIEVFTTNVDGAGSSKVALDTPILLDGVKVRYFASNHLRRLYWAPTLGQRLNRNINRFDVVHLHSVFLWPTWFAARVAARAGVPYLVSPRGMLVKELIKRRSRFTKTMWINLIERKTLGLAAAIHATSELEGNELRRFGWDLPRIVTIANGVEDPGGALESNVANDVKNACQHQPLILFFGRLSWKKGLERLLDGFAQTEMGHLIIAGTDEENLRPRLYKRAEQLGIGDRVSFLSRTMVDADKEWLFSAAQIFVLPSYSENFGNSVLEAMRRGLPVVVTPEVGAAEIVREARGGVITAGTPGSLGQALKLLMADPEGAQKMGESGQRYVLSQCSWLTIAERMERLYHDLIERSQSTRLATL